MIFFILPIEIRHIIIKYIEKEKEDDSYYIFDFGKYKNESSKTVIEKDINYIKWFVKNINMSYCSRKQLFKLLDESTNSS